MDMVAELYCSASCCGCGGDPHTAGQAAPTTLPVRGGGRSREGPDKGWQVILQYHLAWPARFQPPNRRGKGGGGCGEE